MSSQINILIAEDHKLFRQLLIPALEKYNVITIGQAENGIELLELLKTTKPDLILLDIEMPFMNGSETFNKIRVLYPDLKIIFLTTHNDSILIDYFYSKGACAYLNKSTDSDIVVESIKLVHENKYVPIYKVPEKKTEDDQKPKFSRRESEIIQLICEGKSNKEIADHLHITNKTVEAHKKSLFLKTKTMNVVECVVFLLKKGLNNLR